MKNSGLKNNNNCEQFLEYIKFNCILNLRRKVTKMKNKNKNKTITVQRKIQTSFFTKFSNEI